MKYFKKFERNENENEIYTLIDIKDIGFHFKPNVQYNAVVTEEALLNIANEVTKTLGNINEGGWGGCAIFAKIFRILTNSQYDYVHIFDQTDEYDDNMEEYLQDNDDDKIIFLDTRMYYFTHTYTKIGRKKFDSTGFTSEGKLKKRFNMEHLFESKDEDGSLLEDIIETENNGGIEFAIADDDFYTMRDIMVKHLNIKKELL